MPASEFWDLTWYDWGLWCLRIMELQRQRRESREIHLETTRSFMALYVNMHMGKGKTPVKGSDFWKLSYDTQDEETENKLVGIDNEEFLNQMKERFGKYKKRGR